MIRVVVFSIVAVLSFYSTGFAQLQWERRDIELKASPGPQELKTSYSFKNMGSYQVTITSIRPSCTCTVAALDKKVIAPGESGVLQVTFKPDGRTGLQQKQILLETDETSGNHVLLTLKVDVPRSINLDKPFVYWMVGDEAKSQEVSVKMATPLRLVSVRQLGGTGVTVDIKELKASEAYTLTVTPKSTALPSMVTLELVTEPSLGMGNSRIQAMVRKDQPTTQPVKVNAEKP